MLNAHAPTEVDELTTARRRVSKLERQLTALLASGPCQSATVAAILPTLPPTLRVISQAGTALQLRYHSAYAPTVGDAVLIMASDVGWFVLGKLA